MAQQYNIEMGNCKLTKGEEIFLRATGVSTTTLPSLLDQ